MPLVWVLLPAFNEAANISRIVREARAVRFDGTSTVVIVVDDGSSDETAARAEAAGARVLRHPKNRGVGASFRTGRDAAIAEGVDYLIHMDSDGQVLPSEILLVSAPVMRGEADLALGSRFASDVSPENMELWKAFGLRSMSRAIGVATGYHLTDVSCGFRCMNRRILEVARPTFDYDYIQETLIQALAARARVIDVPVTVIYDGKGPSGLSARTLQYGRGFLGLTAYALVEFYRTRAMSAVGRARSPAERRRS